MKEIFMTRFGFLSVLEEEMDNYFTFDYAIDWHKKNHAVEVSFILEAKNQLAVETIDEEGECSNDDILFEDAVLFYDITKSTVKKEDYLATIPFQAKKGFSREFLAYFAKTLDDVATKGLDALMDFLADDETSDFMLEWSVESFENGQSSLKETVYYPYPRY